MDEVAPGSGYQSLRQTAAALQASLANGLRDLPPELSSKLITSPQRMPGGRPDPAPVTAGAPAMTPAGLSTAPADPSIIPAAGGMPAVARSTTGPDGNDLTPIFHALSTGSSTDAPSRGAEVDPAVDFWRDPLGAPIPAQAASEGDKMAEVRPLRPLSAGRHRRDRPAASDSVWTG